ncbi:DUF1572 family protein [Winogradskyella immobilis]|uniref:DUF1572 family protein n=1 Tax=Winogradskyella immobilis TaxID=2816852 RepID=A0ABS8EKJ7_9FLAO|nr:DUF1572 family protein [Winogradskyella immobilis]MCC1483734.1 DUF1572 family protein [Winogradskyella immobilis]MCG0015828.1 DUF1572 domain-containing protein [Winogradskyella immobilis]
MQSYLPSVIKQFTYYKTLGDKTIEQLNFEQLRNQLEEDSNSIAVIVKHLTGNMLSRWTNFLIEDGEKSWRQRDEEFEANFSSKSDIISCWNKGWDCLFTALSILNIEDLERVIYIRNQGHTVTEAINRQMMHYAYHIGQIVLIGKQIKGIQWQSLSIPRGESRAYNTSKFNTEKGRRHFTDDL